ncbi:hypothetical protein A3K72_01100 [Candidatus Woesearchaeota archaeon RBG_13_36_6]|nr:MAG: hypothetical protein A3K72_01100 [Candidatus Woesearchaeota archaeon RBG_13_36_6]
MKVLITHELFLPDFAGGGEKLVYEMAKGLKKAGHEVRILTTGNPKIKYYEDIPTIRIPIHRYFMNFAFLRILREARWADIIQTSTYNACLPSWMAGKILRKPVVCLIMSYWGRTWFEIRGIIFGALSMLIENLQVNRSYDKIIYLSDFSKEFARKNGLPLKNAVVISPGLELGNYKSLKKEDFVLFSARFSKQKGVYDCIKVARKLPNIKFVMMGWGEEESNLRKIAPSNVHFSNLTLKDGKNFFEQYGHAPLFFLPSRAETFGFVLVEAMASGCAIVSTIPLGYEGYVVGSGDVDSMHKKIRELMADRKKMLLMGKRNTNHAKKYTWDNFIKRLLTEYQKLKT